MTFGPSGHVHDTQNQLFLILEAPIYYTNYKNESIHSWEIECFKTSNFPKSQMLEEMCSNMFENLIFLHFEVSQQQLKHWNFGTL